MRFGKPIRRKFLVGLNPVDDLSGDGKVTIEDFALLAQVWLKCGLYSCQ